MSPIIEKASFTICTPPSYVPRKEGEAPLTPPKAFAVSPIAAYEFLSNRLATCIDTADVPDITLRAIVAG